jgi:hypothetical protein
MQNSLGPAASRFRAAPEEYSRTGATEMILIDVPPDDPGLEWMAVWFPAS